MLVLFLSGGGCSPEKEDHGVENGSLPLTSEEQAYVRRYLAGVGKLRRVVIEDRLLRYADATPILRDSPTLAVDGLAARYLAESVPPGFSVERTRHIPPPYRGTPVEGRRGEAVAFPPDAAFLKIFDVKWRRRSDTNIVESIPAIAFYGGRAAVPAHYVELLEPAPGDIPCQEYCRTAEEALLAIRGRLRLIARDFEQGD